jgi:hypothetical protein
MSRSLVEIRRHYGGDVTPRLQVRSVRRANPISCTFSREFRELVAESRLSENIPSVVHARLHRVTWAVRVSGEELDENAD